MSGEHAVVLAEEWQTVQAVLHLDQLLRRARLRDRVTIIWTANNVFGFERIDWEKLKKAALIATVSRYMKYQLQPCGVDPVVIPNGLSPDAYLPPEPQATARLKRRFKDRIVITKMARWDPDKRWLTSVDIAADLKRRGLKPLLIARGGMESHGAEVLERAHGAGLRIHERHSRDGGIEGILDTLRDFDDVDMINLTSRVDADSRRVLFKASNVVLANSEKEPFGLVGLEAMAVGGIACTGCSGEDYAISGRNALVLQSNDPQEFLGLYKHLQSRPKAVMAMRRAGRATAKAYAWPQVIERNLEPQIELARSLTA
ncbi:MAG: glycosyltransferase [Deltaproteobacteria bacterium]|nr:glycosyltransferase [Deltaproteobacteria bacterium]